VNSYCLMALLGVSFLIMVGCESNGVYFEDDIQDEFEISLDRHPADRMHLPYAVGANVKVTVSPDDDDETQFDHEAFFESENPDIAKVLDDTGEISADGSFMSVKIEAKAAGKTKLVVYKNSDRKGTWGKVEIEVEEPDTVFLIPADVTFLREERKNINLTNPIRIIKDQRTTLLARYYAGEKRLYGNSVMMLENDNQEDTGINLEIVQAYNNENRDWLRVEMLDTESHTIHVGSILNPELSTLEFKGVEVEEVETIIFWSDSEENIDDEQEVTVWALAQNSDKHPVFGTGFNWAYNDEAGLDYGDIYIYCYNRNEEATLAATMGEVSGSTVIHGGAGYVDDSNEIEDFGCSSQNGLSMPMLLAALLGCFMSRRKRKILH